jgi:hypothetical protein
MQDFKPNSHRFKEEQKAAKQEERHVQKVVTGGAKTKKKSGISKFADAFGSEDPDVIREYVVSDLVMPTAKQLLFDIIRSCAEMFIFGDTGRRGRSSGGITASYTSYYDRGRSSSRDRGRVAESTRPRTRFDYDDITFESRGDAERVLDEMDAVIKRYGVVTVANLYEMAGLPAAPFTYNNFGWASINTAEVVRYRGEYLIKLPKAMPID